ncbi:MAG: isoprenylcysteine carboxylmethyltransferase family protein [Anaerolineae bacterium]|nr:isoprenylcysteine carboxylmethyltransferase family protein [Anaerolineae bacterium]
MLKVDSDGESHGVGWGASPEERRAIARWLIEAAAGLVGYGFILFLSAGRLDWFWGWVALALFGLVLAAHPLILLRINPGLLAERQRGLRDPRVAAWDRRLVALAGGSMLLSWAVAGLDTRFGWTGPMPTLYHVGGLALAALGYGLFLWAMASNAFFAEGVRIQGERGHTVATGGPYRYVRHPGYAGGILSFLGIPLLLGSVWALMPAGMATALYVRRTALEDTTLMGELPGYAEYARRTHYRLLPGVWRPCTPAPRGSPTPW